MGNEIKEKATRGILAQMYVAIPARMLKLQTEENEHRMYPTWGCPKAIHKCSDVKL